MWTSVDPEASKYLEGELNGGIYSVENLNNYPYSFNNPISYTDKNGKFAWVLVGAVAGASFDIAKQYYGDAKGDWHNINWGEVGVAGVAGGLSGGVGYILETGAITTMLVNGAAGGVIGAGQQAGANYFHGESIEKDVVSSGIDSFFFSFFSSAAGIGLRDSLGYHEPIDIMSLRLQKRLLGLSNAVTYYDLRTFGPELTKLAPILGNVVSNVTSPLLHYSATQERRDDGKGKTRPSSQAP